MNIQSWLCFILIIISTSCRTPATPERLEPSSANLLFILDGNVKIRRMNWKGFFQASSGTVLYPGDQLRPESGAHVTVLCNDLLLWAAPSGTISGVNNGCLNDEKTFWVRSAGNIGGTRGSNNPLIPYIISPRSTKIFDSRPLLHWNAVSSAQSYTVKLHGDGFDWQAETKSNQLPYSGKINLKPGITYGLIVETNDGQSSLDEGAAGLSFTLLPNDIAAQVENDISKIDLTDLSDNDKQYAIAQLYASTGLTAESIRKFEDLIAKNYSNPRAYSMIGDLYLSIGLPYLAEPNYLKGLEISKTINDIEATGMSQYGLGEIYTMIGNHPLALKWFHLAELSYRSLGDFDRERVILEKEQNLTNKQ